jgi:hypothetical protein
LVGECVGEAVGEAVGASVGAAVGASVGVVVGAEVGATVGEVTVIPAGTVAPSSTIAYARVSMNAVESVPIASMVAAVSASSEPEIPLMVYSIVRPPPTSLRRLPLS